MQLILLIKHSKNVYDIKKLLLQMNNNHTKNKAHNMLFNYTFVKQTYSLLEFIIEWLDFISLVLILRS